MLPGLFALLMCERRCSNAVGLSPLNISDRLVIAMWYNDDTWCLCCFSRSMPCQLLKCWCSRFECHSGLCIITLNLWSWTTVTHSSLDSNWELHLSEFMRCFVLWTFHKSLGYAWMLSIVCTEIITSSQHLVQHLPQCAKTVQPEDCSMIPAYY